MPASNPIHDAARAVLCVLLNDSYAIIPVLDILKGPEDFELPTHHQAYAAILELLKTKTVPNVYTVSAASGIPVADLQTIAAGFNTKLSKEVLYTAALVAADANYRRVKDAVAQAGELASAKTDDPQGLAVVCAEMIMGSADQRGETSADIGEVSKRFDAEVAALAAGDAGVNLGDKLAWLQGKTSGLRPGHVWVISAPYKGRKTTFMRNMLISVCRAGASVDLFALEGTESGSYAGLVAMLATERLLADGNKDEAILSETFIVRGSRTPVVQAAITAARVELAGWNLRIYDGRKGIARPERLAHYVKRDCVLHGLNVFAVDYLQLLGEGRLFERMEANTHQLQRITAEEGLTAILLAQLNEVEIGQASESYSPGIKGGGDAAAAADFLIRTRYNGEATPDVLTVQLKLARHARPGTQAYRINAQSGLILSPYGKAEEA